MLVTEDLTPFFFLNLVSLIPGIAFLGLSVEATAYSHYPCLHGDRGGLRSSRATADLSTPHSVSNSLKVIFLKKDLYVYESLPAHVYVYVYVYVLCACLEPAGARRGS